MQLGLSKQVDDNRMGKKVFAAACENGPKSFREQYEAMVFRPCQLTNVIPGCIVRSAALWQGSPALLSAAQI